VLGTERISKLLTQYAIPAIIAMTANIFSEDIDAAYAAGMNGHMAKPIDAKTLYQTIAGVLKL
jgi:two-component system sensor histidine kinase/response regulator